MHGTGLLARRCRSATANANCANVGEYRETFAWNADARLAKRTTEIADGAATRSYVHAHGYLGDGDPNVHDGRLATVTYPSGLTVRREYNARGYLARLVDAATNTALETYAAQDAHGNVTAETYGNGAATTRTFQTGAPRLAGVRTVLGAATLQDNAYRPLPQGRGAVAPAMAVRVRSPVAPDATRYLDALGRTIRVRTVPFDGDGQRDRPRDHPRLRPPRPPDRGGPRGRRFRRPAVRAPR